MSIVSNSLVNQFDATYFLEASIQLSHILENEGLIESLYIVNPSVKYWGFFLFDYLSIFPFEDNMESVVFIHLNLLLLLSITFNSILKAYNSSLNTTMHKLSLVAIALTFFYFMSFNLRGGIIIVLLVHLLFTIDDYKKNKLINLVQIISILFVLIFFRYEMVFFILVSFFIVYITFMLFKRKKLLPIVIISLSVFVVPSFILIPEGLTELFLTVISPDSVSTVDNTGKLEMVADLKEKALSGTLNGRYITKQYFTHLPSVFFANIPSRFLYNEGLVDKSVLSIVQLTLKIFSATFMLFVIFPFILLLLVKNKDYTIDLPIGFTFTLFFLFISIYMLKFGNIHFRVLLLFIPLFLISLRKHIFIIYNYKRKFYTYILVLLFISLLYQSIKPVQYIGTYL